MTQTYPLTATLPTPSTRKRLPLRLRSNGQLGNQRPNYNGRSGLLSQKSPAVVVLSSYAYSAKLLLLACSWASSGSSNLQLTRGKRLHNMLANGYEKQKHLYRGYGDGSSCTPRAAATHIFASTFARAKTIRGALALSNTAERDGGLLCCGGRKPSSCCLWLSRRIVVRASRLFHGWSPD